MLESGGRVLDLERTGRDYGSSLDDMDIAGGQEGWGDGAADVVVGLFSCLE
jgi:hypothetical protein